jgi:hypothetical protein
MGNLLAELRSNDLSNLKARSMTMAPFLESPEQARLFQPPAQVPGFLKKNIPKLHGQSLRHEQ